MRWLGSKISATALLLLVILLVTACGDGSKLKPRSSGKPYSVVVVGNDHRARGMVAKMLDIPLAGLPQAEDAFDVTIAADNANPKALQYARATVMVDIDETRYSAVHIRYEKDAYAEPQLIIHLETPSADALVSDYKNIGKSLRTLLDRFETNTALRRLRKSHSPAKEKEVEKAVGCKILVPSDLVKSKSGQEFIWLSDDGSTSMRNMCVYSAKGTDTSAERLVALRDSVMRQNIKGETDSMYMSTERRVKPVVRTIRESGRLIVEMRGIWQMEGDAMGGPFVSHTIVDSLHGRTITAEAFIYAPGEKKRDIIKRMEAALYTLGTIK